MKLSDDYKGFTVSEATLNTVDLVESILDFLDSIGYPETMDLREQALEEEDLTYFLNEDLWDLMNEIAPEGTYFGSHPGDGSLIGFWPYTEEVE